MYQPRKAENDLKSRVREKMTVKMVIGSANSQHTKEEKGGCKVTSHDS